MTVKKYPRYNKYLIYSVDIKFFCVLYFTTLCYLEKGIYTPKGVYPAELNTAGVDAGQHYRSSA